MALKENVKRLRKKSGMTQQELSKRSNVGRVTISRIESGKLENISVNTLNKLSQALDAAQQELIE